MMKKILFLTNKDMLIKHVEQATQQEAIKELVTVTCLSIADRTVDEMLAEIANSAVVLLFLSGGLEGFPAYPLIQAKAVRSQVWLLPLAAPLEAEVAFLATSTVAVAVREQAQLYFTYGGRANQEQLFLWLTERITGVKTDWLPPRLVAGQGIYYQQIRDEQKPTLGIFFSRHEWIQGNLKKVDQLIREIEVQGGNVLAVFGSCACNPELDCIGIDAIIKKYFFHEGKRWIDALLISASFPLTGADGIADKDFLSHLAVPVLQGVTSFASYSDWQESSAGLNPIDTAVSVALPEFDGALITVPIATKEKVGTDIWYEPIEERIRKYVSLALKWAILGKKQNQEKKVAIIFHNYPPTNARIGHAVGLDTPASVCLLLKRLQAEGYCLDSVPENGQQLIAALIERMTNDRGYLTKKQLDNAVGKVDQVTYAAWYQRFPASMQEELQRDWGEPPGDVFHDGEKLLIPGVCNGHIFIGVQPPRGFGENKSKIYHAPDLAPPHHYLAYYRWIRDVFQADAIIHVGKHGSLEWLPGKGVGLSENCYPDAAIADLPNIYPYIINDPGEGTQAKRRSYACIVDHLPPSMTIAGLTDNLLDLERTLLEYREAEPLQSKKSAVLLQLLWEKVRENELHDDLQLSELGDGEIFLEKLAHYLEEIKYTPIRQGLHILGQVPSAERLRDFYLLLLRLPNGEVPSLLESLAEILQCSMENERVWDLARLLVDTIMAGDHTPEAGENALDILRQETHADVQQVAVCLHYLIDHLAPNLQKAGLEMDACVAALAGRYIEPGPSGAITRGMADILPTGRNFYSVDPRAVPTMAAWEVGVALAAQLLARFLAETGKYPENMGIVLWASPVMRNKGDDIAEILYLMGIRPLWSKSSGRVVDLAPISIKELGRPRIDVTVRISGLYRDTFPQGVALLDRAVALAASLDEAEEDNYLRKHILADTARWVAQGLAINQAAEKAGYRVFGCKPSGYGTGVGKVLDEGNWQTKEDLKDIYLAWGSFAYGQKAYGIPCQSEFAQRLGQLELTVQNQDSRELNLLDGDDYNAYHGGMNTAVHCLSGKAPRAYCGDSSKPQAVQLKSLSEEMKRIFRTQVLNPKWIASMQEHGYKAAGDCSALVSRCFGWDATSAVLADWMYQELAATYALDEQMQKWMKEVNPWALQAISEKLLEAIKRNMWNADTDTRKKLQKLYLEMEGELEAKMDAD